MKNRYIVTLMVADRNALADIIDAVEGKATSVEITTVSNVAPLSKDALAAVIAPKIPRMRRERRSKRRSKVNEAILNAVTANRASIGDLKIALENAGMSASSLSTGIAVLTKSGQIERVGDGLYALKSGIKTMKAVEAAE